MVISPSSKDYLKVIPKDSYTPREPFSQKNSSQTNFDSAIRDSAKRKVNKKMKYLNAKRENQQSPEQSLKEFISYLEQKNLINTSEVQAEKLIKEYFTWQSDNKENLSPNNETLSPALGNRTSMSNEQGFVISENSSQILS